MGTNLVHNNTRLISLPRRLRLTLLVLFLASTTVTAQRETVDKIVAVVGDQVILASELAGQIQFVALQSGRQPRTESEAEEFQNEVLSQMISDQLFLVAARQDTTISIREEEVEAALDERVTTISGNFPTHQAFLDALAAEGITLRDLRKKFKGELRNQLLKQRFISNKLSTVSISRHEVEQFYNEFRDSIPPQPEAAKVAHLLLGIQPSPELEDAIKTRATELRQEILDGGDFTDISRQHSSMGAGAEGGDLGWISREDVVEEFARAAFQLQVGDISGVVRTQFGYHVIKCEGKRDDQLLLRHLLLTVTPSPEDTVGVMRLADSLVQSLREGASFEETTKIFSIDDETRTIGGELGWFAMDNLPPEFATTIAGWKTPGEYRGPLTTQFGVHLFKLLEYQAKKEYTLEDDFDSIKELARQDKTGRMVDKWIGQIKEETYIDNRLDKD